MEQVTHPYINLARLPYSPSTLAEARQNFATRARQLLLFEYVWTEHVHTFPFGYTTTFMKDGEVFTGILQNSTGATTCYEVMDYIEANAGKFIDFGGQLPEQFRIHNPPTEYVDRYQYKHVERFYGSKRAERSGVLKMNHIDEAITIINRAARLMPAYTLNDASLAISAFCLHPMFQDDDILAHRNDDPIGAADFHSDDIMNVMEYRSVANEYLSQRTISSIDEIRLSPLRVVNLMLIGDKVQNYKDFLKYHFETHPRTRELSDYFQNWLDRLGINHGLYHKLTKHIPSV